MLFRRSLICLVVFAIFASSAIAQDTAGFFNVAPDFTPSKDEVLVALTINRLCKKAGVNSPIGDPALSVAAREVVNQIAEAGMDNGRGLDNTALMAAIVKVGGSDVAIRAQAISLFSLSGLEEVLVQQKIVKDIRDLNMTHVGIGIHSKLFPPRKHILLVFSRRPITLGAFPRKIMPGQKPSLSGHLFAGVQRPRVLFAKPSGNVEKIPLSVAADGGFSRALDFDEGGGKYTVQIQVDSATGPEIAAMFEVHSLAPPSRAAENAPYIVIPDLPPVQSELEGEARIFSMINSARQSARKVHLVRNGRLDEVARAYAREMIAKNFFGHISPDGKNVTDRVVASGVKYSLVGENIAVNETVIKAHRGLMKSPAHSGLVLDERFTQVGVGVIFKDNGQGRAVFVVEVFMLPR